MARVVALLLLFVAACALVRADYQHGLREFLTTEATYLRGLRTMLDLKETMATKLSEKDAKNVFQNIDELVGHSSTLSLALNSFEANSDPRHVCPTLLQTFHHMYRDMAKSYSVYIGGQDAASVALNSLSNKRLAPLGGQQYLAVVSSLLITPVQRLPRYRMLLKEISEGTTGTEGKGCYEALDIVKMMSATSNEQRRQQETTEKLALLRSLKPFNKDSTGVENAGYLVSEQTEDSVILTKVADQKMQRNELKNVQVVLFDHMLALIVKNKKAEVSLEDATMTQTPNGVFTVDDGHGTTVEFQGIYLKPHIVDLALEETSYRKTLAKSIVNRHGRRSNAVHQSTSRSGVVDSNDNSIAASSNTQPRQRRNAFVKLAPPDQPTL